MTIKFLDEYISKLKNKILFMCAIIIPAIIVVSCEENVAVEGDFNKKYFLYSLINTESDTQTAFIYQNYQVGGDDPYVNKTDPFISGAKIWFVVNGTITYYLQEGTKERTDTLRYHTPYKYYYVENFKPSDNDRIEIIAELKDGRRLYSAVVAPRGSQLFLFSSQFVTTYDPRYPGKCPIKWNYSTYSNSENYRMLLHFYLVYSKADNPEKIYKFMVPCEYVKQGENLLPVYPKITQNNSLSFEQDAIKKSIDMISNGDADKSKYIFHEAELTLLLLDEYLASYIEANNIFREEFSVRISEYEFSNIRNGMGLFAAYSEKKGKLKIDAGYLRSLGYRTSY